MSAKLERRGRKLILGLAAFILMAGCAPSLGAQRETPLPPTPTPDPLYTVHCIRTTGRNDLCYGGQLLLANRELLEKAMRDFCNTRAQPYAWCSVHVWGDEASVAQAIPLTAAETSSRIARLSIIPNSTDCFQTYDHGEITYSSSGCKK